MRKNFRIKIACYERGHYIVITIFLRVEDFSFTFMISEIFEVVVLIEPHYSVLCTSLRTFSGRKKTNILVYASFNEKTYQVVHSRGQ